jgi:hypothetical protein
MFNITFLLAAIILWRLWWADRGNSSMGHVWLPTGLTMRMEQHKVQRIVSRVQVTNPP